jgi:hypothetical protein
VGTTSVSAGDVGGTCSEVAVGKGALVVVGSRDVALIGGSVAIETLVGDEPCEVSASPHPVTGLKKRITASSPTDRLNMDLLPSSSW